MLVSTQSICSSLVTSQVGPGKRTVDNDIAGDSWATVSAGKSCPWDSWEDIGGVGNGHLPVNSGRMSEIDLLSDDEASPGNLSATTSGHFHLPSQPPPNYNPSFKGPNQAHDQSRTQSQPQSQAQSQSQPSAYSTGNTNLKSATNSPAPSNVNSAKHKTPLVNRSVLGHSSTVLPAEKVFPIQVGTELFRLSGASISSDGPSYFTQFFEEQVRQNEDSGGVRTLYIDRDPTTFRDIARHLQGYYVTPNDGSHFVRLFADAQFYSLPRLITQLFDSEIFIQIGEEHFQIPKDIFSDPGNSPNFFSLGFAVFFSTPNDVFPGLDRRGLLRPPPINPPHVPNRSSEIFAQILHLLRGYPLEIKNEIHREQLLRDCRYFHLRGLEQRIIAHDISYNLERRLSEICIRLEDIRPSGISYQAESRESPIQSPQFGAGGGWVYYSRPFVDETPYELIMEIGKESTVIDLENRRAEFRGVAKARVISLLQVVANKMNLTGNVPLGLVMLLADGSASRDSSPGFSALSDEMVKVQFDSSTALTLDGEPHDPSHLSDSSPGIRPSQGAHYHLENANPGKTTGPTSAMNDGPSVAGHAAKTLPKGGKQPLPVNSRDTRPPQQANSQNAQTINTKVASVNTTTNAITTLPPQKKRKLDESWSGLGKWIVRTGQWRLRVQPTPDPARSGYEAILVAVKLDAFSCERSRNARRGFLTG